MNKTKIPISKVTTLIIGMQFFLIFSSASFADIYYVDESWQGGTLTVWEEDSAYITGGELFHLEVEGGYAEMLDGIIDFIDVRAGSFMMSGGTIDEIEFAKDDISIIGGTIDTFVLEESGNAYISGGTISKILYDWRPSPEKPYLTISGGGISTLEIANGDLGALWIYPIITVECKTYNIIGDTAHIIWADNSRTQMEIIYTGDLGPQEAYTFVHFIEVPEPVSFLLISLGGILLRRRK